MNPPTSNVAAYEREAILRLVAAAQTAQADAEILLDLHTAETVIVNIAGRRILGRDAFGEAMAAALSSPLRDVRTEVTVGDIRPAGRDAVIVSCTKKVRDGRPIADARAALPVVGALTYVVVRSELGWRIALAQTTPIVTA